MKPRFDYATFTTRTIGFVTADQQTRFRQSCVFVCGVGGMGRLMIADVDDLESSNLNWQVLATTHRIGCAKAVHAAQAARDINPEVEIDVLCRNGVARFPEYPVSNWSRH